MPIPNKWDGVVILGGSKAVNLRSRLQSWFPDREFFMRSQGQVRFIKLSSRLQIFAAGAVVTALLIWAVTMAGMAVSQYTSQRDRLALLEREAKIESAESRVAAYRDNLDETAESLANRMEFIERTLETYDLSDVALDEDTVTDSSGEAAETVAKVSAAIPEAAELARIEARQLAFVERLTRYADQRAERATKALRQLGLDPNRMAAGTRTAQGGPLELLGGNRKELDPRFERLGLSLARMDALERSLGSVPQFLPAPRSSISSGFGYRRDPFTGRAAMHSGLDFKAAQGTPVYAAANGRVSFVGRKSGYGKVVEISHGNGMMTRYAHLSAFKAKQGQKVEAGDRIGAIGSTGRSTGPHLHFEVRINDRAVNPRPFLEAAPRVLEEARGGPAARGN